MCLIIIIMHTISHVAIQPVSLHSNVLIAPKNINFSKRSSFNLQRSGTTKEACAFFTLIALNDNAQGDNA